MREGLAFYLHVPFCRKKCPYCDFYSLIAKPDPELYLRALKTEIGLLKTLLSENFGLKEIKISTFYAGGGTPSLLPPNFYEKLFYLMEKEFLFQPVELTLEANPESLTQENTRAYQEVGFNRLSIGIEALTERGLKFLERVHTVKEALRALEIGGKYFSNISADLIFGYLGQGEKTLLKELTLLLKYPLTHLSLYELTPYEETPFSQKYGLKQHKKNQRLGRRLFLLAHQFLEGFSFEHYEIANYAKPGFACEHNLYYWRFKPYLGLGPSAVSRVGPFRWQNPPDFKLYLKVLLKEKRLPHRTLEWLSPMEMAKEILFMGLRLKEGISIKRLREELRVSLSSQALTPLLTRGLLNLEGEKILPTLEGFLRHSLVVKYLWDHLKEVGHE